MDARARGRARRKNNDGWEVWGGYMEAKKQKLQTQYTVEDPREGSGSDIFSGISIHVDGYTRPSSDELKRLVRLHGGKYEHYLYRTRVTHVIATNLPDSKVRELKGLKVVRPEWITESVKAGTLLPYTTYQLYTKSGGQQGLSGFAVRQNKTHSATSGTSCDVELDSVPQNGLDLVDSKCDIYLESSNTMDIDECSETLQSEQTSPGTDNSVSHNSVKQNSVNVSSNKTKPQVDTHHSTSKAGDPRFLNEFYNNSRLHHLSAWKAEFRDFVNHLQTTKTDFPGREKLCQLVSERDNGNDREILGSGLASGKLKRCVMHIDMDCFFVSVGLRRRPDLIGKPVAVTHSRGKSISPAPGSDLSFEKQQWELRRLQGGKKGRKGTTISGQQLEGDTSFPDQSESDSDDEIPSAQVPMETQETFHSMADIASCSYEARKAGVRNGMLMGAAKQICPELVTIPYDFEGYQTVSKALYNTVASYTHDIEAVSCDEMLVDCTDLLSSTGATPLEFASLLRQEIYEKTNCSASAGLASNILLAKMATRKAKPNGQFYLTEHDVQAFITPQSVQDVPGVGWSLSKKLEHMKVKTCGDLQKVSLETLQRELGPKIGQSLYRYCRGQDDRRVQSDHQRKSISTEVNYGIRFTTESEAVRFLQELSEEVCARLKNIHLKGKSITLRLMVRREDAPTETAKFLGHGICNNLSKSVNLPLATDDARIVGKECVTLLRQLKAAPEDLRGIGVQIQKLEPAEHGTRPGGNKTQSILNFTVNKAQTFKKNGEASSNQSSCSNLSNISDSSHDLNYVSDKNSLDQSKIAKRLSVFDHSELKIGATDQSGSALENGQSEVPNDNCIETLQAYESQGRKENNGPSENLVEELGRRQLMSSHLPPLPTLPDIPTPDSGKKRLFKPSTPHQQKKDTKDAEDYFPSPSQVDPAVLKELPPDIREQIEKEMTSRQLRKKPSKPMWRSDSSEQGCSHWDSDPRSRDEADKSKDVIEALPSPSQIDMSCLNALPLSLQREIKEAYARQGLKKADLVKRNSPLKLQQAKSPSKSPNKRSPRKSPQFKVPRGKASGRGKKKVTSKKLLFSEQTKTVASVQEEISRSEQITNEKNDTEGFQPKTQDKVIPVGQGETAQKKIVGDAETGVNLCGAVDITEVRSLIKEWICSTPEPQQEDEEVLVDYLEKLVLDKNLEQVDLVLKFMYRNIHYMNSTDWLLALKRIFTQTQAIVRSVYGGTLKSIPVL